MRIRRRGGAGAAAVIAALCLGLAGCSDAASRPSEGAASGGSTSGPTPCPAKDGSSPRRTSFAAPPPLCIDTAAPYSATVVTDVGSFVIALDAASRPQTVNNFVVLSRYRFYDGVTIHRAIPGYLIQGGDPQGTGRGGPGYRILDELPRAGAYQVGSVAMANSGPNSAGSQFFIVTGPKGLALPPEYALFGKVTSGMDVVGAIEKDGSATGEPARTHTITTIKISDR